MNKRISITTRSAFPNARVNLVILTEDDAPATVHYANDYDVMNTLGNDRIRTISSQKEWLANAYKREDDFPFGIWLKKEERLIGTCGLHQVDYISGTGKFGIVIGDPSEWNKGYGTETLMQILHFAFIRKNLRKVSLSVFSHNPRGKRCYEKCGFNVVGVQTKHDYRNGAYQDRITMEIFREEWERFFLEGVVTDIWSRLPKALDA